jgi:hypothetical protein
MTTDDIEDAEQDRPDDVRQNVYVERRLTPAPHRRRIVVREFGPRSAFLGQGTSSNP